LTVLSAEKRKEFSNIMLSIHAAERKEACEEGTAKPESSLEREVSEIRYRLLNLVEDLVLRPDRPRSAAAAAAILAREREEQTRHHNDAAPSLSSSPNAERRTLSSWLMADDAAADQEIEEAIRASLQEFNVANSPAATILEQVEQQQRRDDAPREWACPACTYMNARGWRCAMCRTPRASTL
jgi:signal recognition particle GTPase